MLQQSCIWPIQLKTPAIAKRISSFFYIEPARRFYQCQQAQDQTLVSLEPLSFQ
jgi:hypothetical protein